MSSSTISTVDIALIGGGIMSATMASMFTLLRPDWSIAMFERDDAVATESSGEWNNAGTGHASLCELNYTPRQDDGAISTTKALAVNSQFHESLRYWAHLVQQGQLSHPDTFIRSVPHISYVAGEEDVDFLKDRYDALKPLPAFRSMTLSEDPAELATWAPLMFENRSLTAPVAMTRSEAGTDVNFGDLTRQMVASATGKGMELRLGHEVTSIQRLGDGWSISVRNRGDGSRRSYHAKFVFVGAGGAAIHLLQKSGIPEAKGYGGFPVSGQFLRCTNEELVARHSAKVYGQPQLNAPPMSMPHLDTRVIDGQQVLLFGPFAGFETRFLKNGSLLDLVKSIKPDNLKTYLNVARDEFGLTTYLIHQVLLRQSQKVDVLRDFIPNTLDADWQLHKAGMRVQTMKRGPNGRGKIEFGTEVVASQDGTIAGLLGASPGASTAVSIVLQILETCFPDEMARGMQGDLGEIFPLRSLDPAESESPLIESENFICDVLGLEGYGSSVG